MCPAMSDRSDVVALVAAGALGLLAGADAELLLAPGARSSDLLAFAWALWALLALAALSWVVAPDVAPVLRGVGLLLYAGWAWSSAGWLSRLSKP